MSKYSDQQILTLFFAYPMLFDSTTPEFRDMTIREHSWNSISKEIGCNATECKELLRSIRLRYSLDIQAKTSEYVADQDVLLKNRACTILDQCPELSTSSPGRSLSEYAQMSFYSQSICEQSLSIRNEQRSTPSLQSDDNNLDMKPSLMLQCSSCPEGFRDGTSLSSQLPPHSPLRCQICNSLFTHLRYLEDHMRCHRAEQDFQCKACTTHSGTLKILPAEQLKTHGAQKQFQCPICERAFAQSSNLKTHMKIHSGERPFQCPVCPKAFAQSSNMKSHLKIHTGERPYECSMCPRAFTQSSNLKEHIKTHTGERPFQCSLCERAFTQLSNLKEHIKIHTGERPHECPICKKNFTQAANMKDHIKTHTDERDYVCSTCDKRFIQMSALRSHEKIHTGERPYQCSICEKAFVQASNLRQHMKIHHESLSNSLKTIEVGKVEVEEPRCSKEWSETTAEADSCQLK